MKLSILLPNRVFREVDVVKVVVETDAGQFCMLPRHVDAVGVLVPGLLEYVTQDGTDVFSAVDEGVVVKSGPNVTVSTRRAIEGPDLGVLQKAVEEEFRVVDETERRARSTAAGLEAALVRRFIEFQEHGR